MTTSATETDPARRVIVAALGRMFAGTQFTRPGRLSVSQLAVEAGIARWYLTHQHPLGHLMVYSTVADDGDCFGRNRRGQRDL